jgi:hypothetical protein
MNDENGTGLMTSGATDLVARGDTMQQTRGSYSTAVAVQRPRDLPDVQRRFLQEARLAGETFFYGWGAGRDRVEGSSIKLAMSLARSWGNCAIEALPVQETADAWIFTAAFVDLETGFTLSRQFRQAKKWTVHGKFDAERKDDIRFQIGQSKAARNVVLNALPEWLADKAIEEAKSGVRESIEKGINTSGIAKVVERCLAALAKCGVPEAPVLAKCGVAKREALDVDMLVMLKGDLSAIESGQEWPSALFPGVEVEGGSRAKKTELPTAKANGNGGERMVPGEIPLDTPDEPAEESAALIALRAELAECQGAKRLESIGNAYLGETTPLANEAEVETAAALIEEKRRTFEKPGTQKQKELAP